jgi:hypothetical protein
VTAPAIISTLVEDTREGAVLTDAEMVLFLIRRFQIKLHTVRALLRHHPETSAIR